MGLKLFRTTGHSSLLDTRTAAAWQHRGKVVMGRNPLGLLLIVSIWLGTVGNYALWRTLAGLGMLRTAGDYAFFVAFAIIIIGTLCLLGALLAWPRTIKPLLVILVLVAGAGAHFMLTYGVVIDVTMITNVLQTNPAETRDLVSLRWLVTMLVIAGVPCVWLWRQKVQRVAWPRQLVRNLVFAVVCAVVVLAALGASFQTFSSTMRNHTQVRYLINPLNTLYALGYIGTKPLRKPPLPFAQLGRDAKLGALPSTNANTAANATANAASPLVLLVVGETARSGNFGINGYERPTTPRLATLMARERMVSQRNAWACGTSTAASLPCMFSHLGREAYGARLGESENLLDVLQNAGMAVLWLDNQTGCKGLCDRIASADTSNQKVTEYCATGECFDGIMLHQLDQRIAALPADKRAKGVVVVMHQMGSHGPAYYKRVPAEFKKFTPECASNSLQDCTRAQVVNSFDNTIAYTDHFLASTIEWLKAKQTTAPTAMVYVSDHGESLGENNIYLHGLPYSVAPDVQKHVPWITWMSDSFAARSKIDTACLQSRSKERVSHDNYFHSVLGLLNVQTSAYRKDWDMYAPCVKS
jgi:lipid A ethanolaminephosphotransferase